MGPDSPRSPLIARISPQIAMIVCPHPQPLKSLVPLSQVVCGVIPRSALAYWSTMLIGI